LIASTFLKKVKNFKALKVSNLEARRGESEEKLQAFLRKFGEKLRKIDR
jgi:uncharacterized protein YktB (UPF0637 family)